MRQMGLIFFMLLAVGLSSVSILNPDCAAAPPLGQECATETRHPVFEGSGQVLVALVRRYNRKMDQAETQLLLDSIFSACWRFDLDPLLVASVIAAESSFNPRARSRCGAEGLMQLTKPIQPWLGVTNAYDIRQNIAGGCQYLYSLRRRFGRQDLVLAAYNAGPTRVARLGRIPNIRETEIYINRVNRLLAKLRAEVKSRSTPLFLAQRWDPFVSA